MYILVFRNVLKQTKTNMGKLTDYKSKAPEFQQLKEGDHNVRLVSYKPTDSFHNYDGTLKENLPEFTNPTEQLVITVVSTSNKGGITHRLNLDGYVRYSELTDKELKSGKFVDINGYACSQDPKTKDLVRITDEKRTATCEGMLDQFMAATGLPVGSGIDDLDVAIAEKREFSVKVTKETYDDKPQYRISSFKKAGVMKAVESDIDA